MFAEKWFMQSPEYDEEGSACRSDADCAAKAKKDGVPQSCALVELYVATSISISEFVRPTRSL